MITKLASLYFSGNDCFSAKSCKGYNTAILEIIVAAGESVSFVPRITKDGTTPTSGTTTIANAYTESGIITTSSLSEGKHKFYLDLTGATNLLITRSGNYSVCSLVMSQNEFVIPSALYKTTKHIHIDSEIKVIDTSNINFMDVTLNLTIESGAGNFNCKDIGNNNVPFIIQNVKPTSLLSLSTGTYNIKVDCRNTDTVKLYVAAGTYILDIIAYSECKNLEDYIQHNVLNYYSRDYYIEAGKQVDLTVRGVGVTGSSYLKLQGSNDNSTWTDLNFYRYDQNKFVSNGVLSVTTESIRIYANIEGYEYLRVTFGMENRLVSLVVEEVNVYKEYLEGRKIGGGFQTSAGVADKANTLFKGYRYFKINLLHDNTVNGDTVTTKLKNCDGIVDVFNNGTNIRTKVVYYDRGMNLAPATVLFWQRWNLLGTPTSGGYIIDTKEMYDNLQFVPQKMRSVTGNEFAIAFEIECYVNRPEAETCIVKKYEKNDYSVYQLPTNTVKRDVLNSDILEWEDNKLIFWQGGYLGVRYDIPFNADTVANYNGETIKFAYLLPFYNLDSRKRTDYIGQMFTYSRICVFTNKRVFHNFPDRPDLTSNNLPMSDLGMFDESTIFNKAKQWLPTNDKSKVVAGGKYKYFPVLAEYDYDQFEGRVSGTTGFVDAYGNGGLPNPASNLILDNVMSNAPVFGRLKYSNMTKTTKMCCFGNYNTVDGSEPFVMISNDGGKTWYIKCYFACTDNYPNMRGGKIDLKPITDVAGSYVANSLKMCRKRFNVPSDAVKEPSTPFIVDTNDQSLVTGFSTDADGNTVVTVADNVDYDKQFPIVYFENVSASAEWDYICNTGFNAAGTTNNGVFFRAEKIAANQYKLFGDLGNPFEGDMVCRHIHAVNGVEAGILISTGETYASDKFEGGFMYLLVQNYKNGGQSYNVDYTVNNVIRLTSSYNGVNRASGAYLFSDNDDPTLLWVSDAAYPPHLSRSASIDGRTISVPITPAGIFVGKLSEIDDLTKFKCVCELHTTVVGLVQANGHFAADGHGNAIMFSKNGFDWNIEVDDGSFINGFDNYGNIYFGDKVVMFK